VYSITICANETLLVHREGVPYHIAHDDEDLWRWMGVHGYSDLWELPTRNDYRTEQSCEVCEASDVELHHWAPREWFQQEAEKWPKGYLCKGCHRYWHEVAERAAARLTVRILRSKRLHRIADQIEHALAQSAGA